MNSNRRRLAGRGAALLLGGGVVLGMLVWWADPRVRILASNSLWLAGESTLISLPPGVALAWLLVRTNLPGRGWMKALLVWMLFVPLYLQAAAWEAGFGQLGWYTLMRGAVADPWLDGWRAAVWVHAVTAIPWVVLIVGLGLRYAEAELEEQAMLDAGWGQVLLRVTMPRAWLSIGVAGLWVFTTACSEMTIADLFLVSTYARELYAGYALGDGLLEAWNTTLPSLGIMVWLVMAAALCLSLAAPPWNQAFVRSAATVQLRGWRWPALVFAATVVAAAALVPLANLLLKAGLVAEQIGDSRVRFWSLNKFLETLGAGFWGHRDAFGWTLLIGVLASTAAVLLAAPWAWWARRGTSGAVGGLLAAAACLAIPGPLLGLSIIWLLNRPSPVLIWLYDETVFAPVLALTVRAFPFALAVSWYGLRSIGEDVLESGQLDGAGVWRRFLHLAAPQRRRTWAAAWMAALAITTGDLSASILVVPPDVTTVSIRVFGLIHSGVRYQAAGMCLSSALMFALLAALGWRLISRPWPRS